MPNWITFYGILLILIHTSQDSQRKQAYNIYRIPTPTAMGDKVIMVNFFGQPGIQVLHANGNYTDVKIPKKYNTTFIRLVNYKNETDIHMLSKEYYYGTKTFGFRKSHCQTLDRRSSYIVEEYEMNVRDTNADGNHFRNFEDDNYFTAPFRGFLDYNSIIDYLRSLSKRYSKRIHIRAIGTTSNNRTIYSVIIKSGVTNSTSIFIEGGTIAREWMSITMALYVVREIGTNISAYPSLKNLDWVIVPVVNPDGYEFSYRNQKFRLWQKNRNCLGICNLGVCGVNVDRNFPHYYEGIGASLAPCSSLYLGPSALSEHESRSLQSLMMANRHTLKLYIGLRSFGSYILYPWGLKAEQIFDATELSLVAQTAADAMYDFHKGKLENYTVANYAAIKYPAAGNIMDFARGVINIKYSYVIYLRGDGSGEKSYTPESTEIIHIISECFLGIKSLAEYINSRYPPPKANLRLRQNKRKRHENSACSKMICLALFLLMFFTYSLRLLIMQTTV